MGLTPLPARTRPNRALLRALRARDGGAAERAVAAEIAVGSRVLRRLMPQTGRASI
jgi:DNA-binding GntR family transcriptional regulator